MRIFNDKKRVYGEKINDEINEANEAFLLEH